jgi:hypothetical protein
MAQLAYTKEHVKVADELFLTVALLHREHPAEEAFSISRILERARQEGLGEGRLDQRSLRVHAYEHAAANVPPGKQGGRYRMVFRQDDGRIRLLSATDYVHPDRHQKFYPDPEEVPVRYHELLEWTRRRQEKGAEAQDAPKWLAGLHALRGLGKEAWKGINPDEYVKKLREDWE